MAISPDCFGSNRSQLLAALAELLSQTLCQPISKINTLNINYLPTINWRSGMQNADPRDQAPCRLQY
jgi:hypothetical protein